MTETANLSAPEKGSNIINSDYWYMMAIMQKTDATVQERFTNVAQSTMKANSETAWNTGQDLFLIPASSSIKITPSQTARKARCSMKEILQTVSDMEEAVSMHICL